MEIKMVFGIADRGKKETSKCSCNEKIVKILQ
jgi:hypothetical protein